MNDAPRAGTNVATPGVAANAIHAQNAANAMPMVSR